MHVCIPVGWLLQHSKNCAQKLFHTSSSPGFILSKCHLFGRSVESTFVVTGECSVCGKKVGNGPSKTVFKYVHHEYLENMHWRRKWVLKNYMSYLYYKAIEAFYSRTVVFIWITLTHSWNMPGPILIHRFGHYITVITSYVMSDVEVLTDRFHTVAMAIVWNWGKASTL